ncbi:MAG: hypothetical protein IJB36_02690 [Clostridia bacterium]|nr:hypothetical protein [Clostridia bacterium]
MKKSALICLLVAIMLLASGCSLFGSKYEEESIQVAESYATSAFRKEMGFAADEVKGEVLYTGEGQNESEVYLIAVKCYLERDVVAAYGVYCVNGVRVNATKMLPPGYDFDDNLEDLKALFGIVD